MLPGASFTGPGADQNGLKSYPAKFIHKLPRNCPAAPWWEHFYLFFTMGQVAHPMCSTFFNNLIRNLNLEIETTIGPLRHHCDVLWYQASEIQIKSYFLSDSCRSLSTGAICKETASRTLTSRSPKLSLSSTAFFAAYYRGSSVLSHTRNLLEMQTTLPLRKTSQRMTRRWHQFLSFVQQKNVLCFCWHDRQPRWYKTELFESLVNLLRDLSTCVLARWANVSRAAVTLPSGRLFIFRKREFHCEKLCDVVRHVVLDFGIVFPHWSLK